MTYIKRQKLISSTQVRGYNTQFLLYPQPELIKLIFAVYMCHKRWALHVVIKRKVFLY